MIEFRKKTLIKELTLRLFIVESNLITSALFFIFSFFNFSTVCCTCTINICISDVLVHKIYVFLLLYLARKIYFCYTFIRSTFSTVHLQGACIAAVPFQDICISAVPLHEICIYAVPLQEICISAVPLHEICIYAVYLQEICISAVFLQEICISAAYWQEICISAVYLQETCVSAVYLQER